MERVSTGNRQADLVLGGGFPANSIHVVMGQPGSGKTIFTEQLAFANLGPGRPVLYLTTISEPLPKILTYLQEFTFARVEAVGTEILYESIADTVTAEPARLGERVLGLLQEHRPRILVIDSFKAIGDLMPDVATWRKVLYELAGTLSAYEVTTFWIGEYVPEMVTRLPEFAVADGIIELTRDQHGTRDDRSLRVVKLRGSAFLGGYHAFRIDRSGLEVFPRLVSPETFGGGYATHEERLKTGIGGLDALVARGWLRGTTTLVSGPAGSGKTLLGLHFLREGYCHGEPGLLVTFQENPTQLGRIAQSLGWRHDETFGDGRIEVLYRSPVELQIDSIVGEIFQRVDAQRVRRIVIDSLGDLVGASRDALRFKDYVYALTQRFVRGGVTAMLTMEAPTGQPGGEFAPMVDNIVMLELSLGEDARRSLRIVKTRGSAHDGRRLPMLITADGIAVQRTP